MLAQDAVVIFDDIEMNKVQFRLTDQVAFDGSNAIEVDLSVPTSIEIPIDLPVSSLTLFRTEFDLTNVDELEVSYFVLKSDKNSSGDIALVLSTSNGPPLVLSCASIDIATTSTAMTIVKPLKCIEYGEWQQRMFVLVKPPTTITSIRLTAYHHPCQLVGSLHGSCPLFQQNLKIYLGLVLMRDHIERIPYDTEEIQIETNWSSDSLYEGKYHYIMLQLKNYDIIYNSQEKNTWTTRSNGKNLMHLLDTGMFLWPLV